MSSSASAKGSKEGHKSAKFRSRRGAEHKSRSLIFSRSDGDLAFSTGKANALTKGLKVFD